MKKTLLLVIAAFSISVCFATTHKIKVVDNQFMPATTNARVGDTILWVWKGTHTHTTTSTTIPTGAKTWRDTLNAAHPKFKYIVKLAGTFNFRCTIHFGMNGKIVVSASPSELIGDLTISAESVQALLKWTTSSDANASYFSIQRSKDGSNFTEIAKLQASSSHVYQYADASSFSDKYVYYQVKLVDKSGNSQLSDIKMFATNAVTKKLITSLSPNPISSPGHLMMQFNADADGKMLVQLFNSSGELLNKTELTAVRGLNNGHFHLGDLKPGSYYIVCTLGDVQEKHILVYQ